MTREEAILFIDELDLFFKNNLERMSRLARYSGKTKSIYESIILTAQYREGLASVKKVLEKGSENCTDDVFDKMKWRCEYGHLSYDKNRVGSWTCHHVNNKPKGCIWGTCDKSVCPILKGE